MRIMKTVTQPAHEETVVDKIACDICKKVAPNPNSDSPFVIDVHTIDKVTIEAEEGSSYPSGGDKKVTVFDTCPECFNKAVIPALAALGAQPRTIRLDW